MCTALALTALMMAAAPSYGQCSQATCPVLYVVDGDTIVVRVDNRRITIRLLGVDAPETRDPRRVPQPDGCEAASYLKLLLDHECVTLEQDDQADNVDSYGRVLAYVVRARDGLRVNLALVAGGHARAIRHWSYSYRNEFCDAERRARESGLGLWRRKYP